MIAITRDAATMPANTPVLPLDTAFVHRLQGTAAATTAAMVVQVDCARWQVTLALTCRRSAYLSRRLE